MTAVTKIKGDITEAAVILEFVKAGYTVCIPHGENQRYDLIVEKNGIMQRVQCKTGRLKSGSLLFSCCNSNKISSNGTSDYRDDVELFATYNQELNEVFVIPVKDAPLTECALRLESFDKGGQRKFVRWAKDYKI